MKYAKGVLRVLQTALLYWVRAKPALNMLASKHISSVKKTDFIPQVFHIAIAILH